MAWVEGNQHRVAVPDSIAEAKALKGELTDAKAKAMLGKLLRYNLGFTWTFLSRQKMFLPFQEIILNSWFAKDRSLVIAGRGVGKSYLLAVFICLYSLMYPNTKIVLVANNFRRVKDIFSQIEKFLNHKPAILLRQCFQLKTVSEIKMGRQNDQYILNCMNGSYVKGLPLGVGENLRGERANVLIIDEGLLISEHVQTTILEPFLTAISDAGSRKEIRDEEDRLIANGEMAESERMDFPSNKLIITSSASYQFEYLYEGLYVPYLKNILNEKLVKSPDDPTKLIPAVKTADDPSFFVARLSYKMVPEKTFLDDKFLQGVKDQKPDNPVFRREYCAEFVDASDSYFSIKKLHECTFKDGETPTVQVKGSKRGEYILAIDPAYGEARSNDYFAMGVYLLVPEHRQIVQVHSYGKAGADIKEHYEYLTYLLTHFNIVYTIIDGSGTEFIDGYNESVIAKQRNIHLGFVQADFEEEGEAYVQQIHEGKYQLNKSTRNFVYAQKFSAITNRRMNEYLQGGISAGKVWFGSQICMHKNIFENTVDNFRLPFDFKDHEGESYSVDKFLQDQDDWIPQTKRQLALIEVKSTGLGTLQYDIPSHLKKSKSDKRARRDNYTCLLMAYYASKHYYDMMFTEDEIQPMGFTPVLF